MTRTRITIVTETHNCSFDAEIIWHPLDPEFPTKTGCPVDQGQVKDLSFSDHDGKSVRFLFPHIGLPYILGYRPPLWQRIKAVFR